MSEDLKTEITDQDLKEEIPNTENIGQEFFEKTFTASDNTKLDSDEIKEETKETDKTDTNKGINIPTDLPKKGVKLGSIISGKTTVKVIDIFIPSLFVFLINKAGYKATKTGFKLNQEEREVLNPVVQECLDYIVINFANPFYTLALVAGLIYGSKILDVIPETKKIMKDIKEETDNNLRIVKDEEETENDIDYQKRINDELLNEPLREEKNKIIIRELESINPENFSDIFRQYLKIYPTRSKTTFKNWYKNNLETFQENYRFEIPE